jgi:lipopolysaccharide export system permease protein
MIPSPLITRIDRYVFRQLFFALIAVTGALVALIWLTQSLRFVELVVNRGLSLRVFLQLTGLLIPNFIAVILPITTFVVVQFVYQRLAGDRELTVMRACGLSNIMLARPAIALMAVSVAACFLLNVYIVPVSYTRFREYQFEIRNRIAAFLLQEGVFTQVSENLTVYVRTRDPDGTLRGIVVDDARDPNNHATILAERGRLISGTGSPRVLMLNGSRQELDKKTGRLNMLTFSENAIDLTSDSKDDQQRFRDSTEMSIPELLNPDPRYVMDQDRPKFVVEAHKRLSGPLTAASFGCIALVAVLMGGFQRHGGIIRPVAAILTVVGLLALNLAIGNLAARSPVLIPLIWIAAILPGAASAFALFAPSSATRRLSSAFAPAAQQI